MFAFRLTGRWLATHCHFSLKVKKLRTNYKLITSEFLFNSSCCEIVATLMEIGLNCAVGVLFENLIVNRIFVALISYYSIDFDQGLKVPDRSNRKFCCHI